MQQKNNVMELLGMADIKPTRMPISLNMNDFENLCFSFKEMCDRDPVINNYISQECLRQTLAYQEQNAFFLDKGLQEETDSFIQIEDSLNWLYNEFLNSLNRIMSFIKIGILKFITEVIFNN